jgi:signal transduction histidine kinase/ligand-binding sensor domain-containing protein/ActR/RegA family two-component response regulator
MIRIQSLYLILISLLLNPDGNSQELPFKFNRITVDNGLSQRTAWTIVQDKYGFMWFGTHDGLNKYDGINFTVYNPQNCPNLKSATINDLMVEKNGDIWLCTASGIYQYQYQLDDIIAMDIFPDIEYREIIRDHQNNYWVASDSGLFFYEPGRHILKQFTSCDDGRNCINTNDIDCIFQDKNSNIWIGTMKGLNLMNPQDCTFYNIEDISGRISLSGKRIAHIIDAGPSSLFISIANVQGGVEKYNYEKEAPYKGKFSTVVSGNSSRSFIDSHNRLWIGFGAGDGLMLIDPVPDGNQKPTVKSFIHEADNPQSLSNNSILDILEDQWGDLWIGSYGDGVNYLSFKRKKFYNIRQELNSKNTLSSNIINCFLEEEKYFWIGTESGLNRIDKSTGKIRQYIHNPADKSSISANAVYALYKDKFRNLWIGTWSGGLNIYNYNTDEFRSFKHDALKSASISSNNIFSILEDKNGFLWIGTIGGGLNLYNYQTSTFSQFTNNPKDPKSIGGNYVDHIYETKNGELWISSYRELNRFDYSSKTFQKYTHQPNNNNSISLGDIEVIFEDSKNHLWIGTAGGLNYFDRKNQKFRRFTTTNGLPNNYIEGIIEDQSGNLWISTNMGLSKFINGASLPDSTIFQNYNTGDGIQGTEFVKRSAYRDSKGYLYFGGTNGYTYFYADSIINLTHKNPILIVDLLLFNKKVKPGDETKILKSNIVSTKDITLSYRQSVFTFEFITLNYLNPVKNNYAYKLEGFEDEWNYVGTRRHATYTNLPPGKYIFRVKASNSDGIWNNEETSIKVKVLPPWWKTLWFMLLMVSFVISLIIFFYRFRFHQLEKQKRILKKIVMERTNELSDTIALLEESKEEVSIQNEELLLHRDHLEKLVEERTAELYTALNKVKESDNLKSSFLANMSHEIRTPMNAILGFSTLLGQDDLETDEKEFFIKTIHSNGNSLLILINDILDISQIESNQLSISKTIFNATEILEELLTFYMLNKSSPIELEINCKLNDNIIFLENDPIRFKQVLNNLLSNAFKYTEEGKIEVNFEIKNNKITFRVTDTGIGIKRKNINSIFERFYKVEENDEVIYRGTGLGLAISKSLITMMGGEIWAESEINKGSKFYFSLPYNISHQLKPKNNTKETDPISFNNLTILIAEDEETNYMLLEKLLKRKGISVHWAEDGKKAITFIEQYKEAKELMVLMDIKMPVMDGYEAIKIIRSQNTTLPVIAVTAYAQQIEKEKILNCGFTDYLSKPIVEKKLFDIIRIHQSSV